MKIFILTDSPYLRTGLGRINKNIIRGLSENHELVLGCWGWDMDAYPIGDDHRWVYKDHKTDKEFTAFPIKKNPKDQIKIVYDILSKINCDIILTIGDYWNFTGFEQLKSQLGYSFKWISYATIESSPIDEHYRDNFKAIDNVIVPTKFGQKVVKDSLNIESKYIPFGIDDTFYKMHKNNIKKARKKRKLDGKFRFISVGKNIFRKNIPAFLEAISIANAKDDRIVGYLHTNVDKVRSGMYDINYLLDRFNLKGIVSTPERRLSNNIALSEEALNIEYNCSDFFVSTSVAEGFGLPILESQKCGLIPMVPNCSAMSDHISSGEIVDTVRFFAPNEQEVGILDPNFLAERMLKAVANYDSYDTDGNIAYAKSFTNSKMIAGIEDVLLSDCGVQFPFDEL
jgi:glycosyltransferase involved in cell wall biosynthesis